MMLEQAIVAFSALSAKNQSRFLARLLLDITIWARGGYSELIPDLSISVSRLAAFNELQHRIAAHIMHLLEENDARYPDDVFISLLFECSTSASCDDKLKEVFEDLYGSFLRSRESN